MKLGARIQPLRIKQIYISQILILFYKKEKQTNAAVVRLSTYAEAWHVIYGIICVFVTIICVNNLCTSENLNDFYYLDL